MLTNMNFEYLSKNLRPVKPSSLTKKLERELSKVHGALVLLRIC